MITLLAFLVWLGISLFFCLHENFKGETGLKLFISFFTGAVVLFISVFALIPVANCGVETRRDNYGIPIYSLKNVNDIKGNFFLGSGYIGSEEYYYMFQKNDNGGLHRIQINSSNCNLFQDENTNPHLSWQIVHYRMPYWASYWPHFPWTQQTMYDIHIPSNSIIQQFRVD